jgi:hypothetical protein
MIENCKIKLIFKSKEPALLFKIIRSNQVNAPPYTSAKTRQLS